MQAEEEDVAKHIENEANYLFWTFRGGNVAAQAKLQTLESAARDFPNTIAQIRRLDAACYGFGDKATAAEML